MKKNCFFFLCENEILYDDRYIYLKNRVKIDRNVCLILK